MTTPKLLTPEELEEIRAYYRGVSPGLTTELLLAHIAALESRCRRLEALADYADHTLHCSCKQGGGLYTCDCGYVEAAALADEKGEGQVITGHHFEPEGDLLVCRHCGASCRDTAGRDFRGSAVCGAADEKGET